MLRHLEVGGLMRGQSLSHGTQGALRAACVEEPSASVEGSSPESSDFDGLSLEPRASPAPRKRDDAQAGRAERFTCELFQSSPPVSRRPVNS